MRKVIFLMHVSLDGFVAGPNGEMDWIVYTPELESYVHALHNSTDTAIYGRATYEMMAGYWPTVLDDPTSDEGARNHARWVNAATKIVVSQTLERVTWENTVIMRDNIAEEITKLKQQPGKDMWLLGSPTLAQTFMALDLIDEYWLNVNPMILGSGKPLFADANHRKPLRLLASQTINGGVVALRYAPAR